jgi:hypothetical protein
MNDDESPVPVLRETREIGRSFFGVKEAESVAWSNETRPCLHSFSIVRADAGHALQQRLARILSGAHGLGRHYDSFKFLCLPG